MFKQYAAVVNPALEVTLKHSLVLRYRKNRI